ncbi:MAG TPA: serine/threonine-protein kinase, partial [Egibacteraceae bacterium]|nr:serine/threonine-protein kinase [Egibacteraceae bacterium]
MREPTDGAEPPREAGASTDGQGPVPSAVLGGRYRLESEIASGGMAAVWRAHDELLDRTVAVKVLHGHLAADDEFRERFRREAVAAAKLTHPHIVGVYDTGSQGPLAWLVMELVEGPTLRDLLDAGGRLEVARAAAIGEKVARGLAFAHERGLVHRDVKPANILLDDDTTVKVADFGIAKAEGTEGDLTGTGTVLGTAGYVAPEQILSEPLTGACDQYALGCVLYEALTARRPFAGASPMETAALRLRTDPPPLRSVRPELPEDLAAAIERALARRPENRFPSAADFADALARFADSGHTLALPAAPAPPPGASPPAPPVSRPASRP